MKIIWRLNTLIVKKDLEIFFPRYCTTCQEMFVKTFSYCENRFVKAGG